MYPGRIDASLIGLAVPDAASALVMICGPQPMIDATRGMLAGLGVPEPQVRSEYFDAAVAASSRLRAERDEHGAADAGPARPDGPDLEVRFTRSGRTAQARPAETLLDLSDREGVGIPSLCRAGVCGTCRTRVVAGDVTCDADLLDASDRAQGFVLACAASPVTACAVEA
jgi:ferredoxin